MAVRLQCWYLISISVSYMSLFFSLSTILDLYLVLKNPFSSSEKRIKKFITISVITSILLASMGLALTKSRKEWLSQLNYNMYMTIAITNLVVAVLVMIFILIRFRKKGMNENIKQ